MIYTRVKLEKRLKDLEIKLSAFNNKFERAYNELRQDFISRDQLNSLEDCLWNIRAEYYSQISWTKNELYKLNCKNNKTMMIWS
ncbi:MAG: hypothetical protein ACOCWM_01040 [Cyclobacteriaceae bacterium]